jgi:secreted trypsin-like serine protease
MTMLWFVVQAAMAAPPAEREGLEHASGPEDSEIFGGWDVAVGDWQDAVGVVYAGKRVGCTGTLIAPNLVLTAGHCLDMAVRGVVVGSTDLGENGEWIRALWTEAYPDHENSYDVALIGLASAASVAPRALAMDCVVDDHLSAGAQLALVGFGATDDVDQRFVDQLQETRTRVRYASCTSAWHGCEPSVMPDGEFAAGGADGDACFGDSGGPAYLLTPAGDYLAGITSRGVGWGCGEGTLFVRADAIVGWVEDVSGTELARPSCPPPPPPAAAFQAGGADTDDDKKKQGKGCSSLGALPQTLGPVLLLLVLCRRTRSNKT